ncbi:hypothetical protein MKX03_015421 [Papaver bracteatum]|nr:hypothetical protein MKX03_015421 [Papaver bracteatum]
MHFFEIFSPSIITDKRLELPKEFTVKYGKKLCDNAIIKVLNGVWHIGMRRADGVILFENGWPEFMEFYSIRVGHVILFRYDGNSKFQVHIFGMDATEIDYPTHNDSTNHDAEMTSTHSQEDEVEVVSIHSDSTQRDDEPSMSSESPLNLKAEPAKHESPQKSRKPKKATPTTFCNKALQATVESVEGFKSENPFFKVTIHVSYIKGPLRVPNDFANSYLRNITQRGITLRISDGRTWEVKYVPGTQYNRRLSHGWNKFVADSHLKEGDICVFELVDREKLEMNVQIFHQKKTFARKVTPKIKHLPEFHATLKAAEDFTSENPFFKVVMHNSYIKGGMVRVPTVFATSHLRNSTETGMITLMGSDGRTWEVRYLSSSPNYRRISHGWRKFVADNGLKEGDVCIFELLNHGISFEMNVHIFRLLQDLV